MTYTPDLFKNCLFNPFEVKPFVEYPALKKIVVKDEVEEAGHLFIPADKIVRYIIALYDPKSPLIRGEQNLLRRKEIAAEIAGFDTENDEAALEILYNHKYDCVVEMIHNFLKNVVKSMEYAMLVGYESSFWEGQKELLSPNKKGSDKGKTAADIKIFFELFQDSLKKFYGEEEVLIENSARIRRFTPETVAKAK
jgi:hypothetical protein